MNISNIGMTAVFASQARILTTSNNISNASTDGYNRQEAITTTEGEMATSSGFFGRGVRVSTVERAYDSLLNTQLVKSQSKGASLEAYSQQITQINNLLSDRSVGISPTMQKFFDGVQAVASAPYDASARQEMLSRADSMIGQFNDVNAFLNSQRDGINTEIQTSIIQINSHAQRIADLNVQIKMQQTATGQPPNDLLDQRDREVSSLNKIVRVNTIVRDNEYSLTIGNGQVLVSGQSAFALNAKPSAADPRDYTLFAATPTGNGLGTVDVPIDSSKIDGGSLGGLLQYREGPLSQIQRNLGRVAMGLGLAMNAQQAQGLDLNGLAGQPIFSIGKPDVIASGNNRGGGSVTALIDPAGAAALKASDYSIRYDGTNYVVTRMPEKADVYMSTSLSNVTIDGVIMDITGAPIAGDMWSIKPTRDGAGKIQMVMTAPSGVAAASSAGGTNNGDNALVMAKLQTKKILEGGTIGLNEGYSRVVNMVGIAAQQNEVASKAQQTLIQQNLSSQQGVSGVNLNEEYVNLTRFQEQFQAAGKILDVVGTLFNTIISLNR